MNIQLHDEVEYEILEVGEWFRRAVSIIFDDIAFDVFIHGVIYLGILQISFLL